MPAKKPPKRQRKPVECWGVKTASGELGGTFEKEIHAIAAAEWENNTVVLLREVTASHPHAPQQGEVKRLREALRNVRQFLHDEDVYPSTVRYIDAALAPKEKRRG